MHSPNAVRVSRSVLLALVTATLTAACADDAPPIAPALTPLPARAPAPVGEPPASSAAGAPAPAIDVLGRVVDDLEQPVVGRSIVVVDHTGQRFEVLTDEEGSFNAIGVVAPYDLLVAPAPSGAVITPLVYLGLKRHDPRIEVFERGGATTRPQSQRLRVAVKLPACPAAWGACWVSAASASASGRGGTAASYTEGATSTVLEVDHAYQESSLRHDEVIDVHVLVGDARYSRYSYGRVLHVAARPGEPMDLGMVALAPVPVGEPLTIGIAGQAETLFAGSLWTLTTQLELLGGATIPLRYEWSPSTTLSLPQIPGATWKVGAWAQSPSFEDRPYFHVSSQAWSGTLPLSATNIAVDIPSAPAPVRPALEGSLSRHGIGLAWTAPGPCLASLVLVDLARGRQRLRAFTADAAIDLRRLEALGLARLQPGEHVFDLTTSPGANVDELTQPDPRFRRDRFDTRSPGAATYQRFRFTVTP